MEKLLRLHITCLVGCSIFLGSPSSYAQLPNAASSAVRPASEAELDKLKLEQEALFGKLKQQVEDLPASTPQREQKLRQLAAIERRIYEETRVRYVSPLTTGLWSGYRDDVRRRVEQYGTTHFPTVDGHKLYGRLVLNLTIDEAGRPVSAEIVRSSGSTLLDQQAMAIARSAGPFAAFDEARRKDAVRVVITESFNFAHVD